MTMRARLSLLLALTVTPALAACGGGSDPAAEALGADDGEASLASGESAATEDEGASREVDAVPPSMPGCPDGKWCSSMYPPDWKADAPADTEGRFLHDFSYAGYHYGETPPAAPPGATYDVVAGFGADATGRTDATAPIQKAIAAASAAGGGVVFFPAGTYRVDQVLTVSTSGVVLRGAGTSSVLRFTKSGGAKAHLTFTGAVQRGASLKLAADAPVRSREIFVADASGLQAGDDVSVGWTITPAFVTEHGMDGTWSVFNGKYEPFFRNKVASVDTTVTPNKVVLEVPLRYTAKTRDGAALEKETGYLREVGLEHLAVSNATSWAAAWAENSVDAILFHDVTDGWVSDVHSVAMPGATGQNASDTRAYHLRSGGVKIESSKRVSVLGSSMENAQNRGSGGNGYLFEISRTNEVLFADDVAKNGRHNFIQNWGFGNAGTVFLRCTSIGSELLSLIGGKLTPEPGASEHHHSLGMATLVDSCRIDDAFKLENRGAWSDGAGHTATDSVVWGASGTGTIVSKQYQWGYVIGTHEGVAVDTRVDSRYGEGTAPEDWVEGRGQGATLFPASLYEDQRAKRAN